MVKKKVKKGKQDLRGYSTSASAPKSIEPAKTSATVDDNEHELRALRSIPSVDIDVVPQSTGVVDKISKRFFRKIENLHDRLIQYNFSEDQIKSVLLGLSYDATVTELSSDLFTLESALDWLCRNETTENLPSLFTEHASREASSKDDSCIEILQFATPSTEQENHAIRFDESASQPFLRRIVVDTTPAVDSNPTSDVVKSWILTQYEYEDSQGSVNPPDASVDEINIADEHIPSQSVEIPAAALELKSLEQELALLQSDLDDQASNYMRSKHELKEMKLRLSKLKLQAKKLRATFAKENAKKLSLEEKSIKFLQTEINEHSNMVPQNVPKDRSHAEDEDYLDGALIVFDEPEENIDPIFFPRDEPLGRPLELLSSRSLQSSTPSIPRGWTGSTPQKELTDWCRKQKIPAPSFSKTKTAEGSYRLLVKTRPEIVVEESGPFYDTSDAHQFLATIALFRACPERPMYRLFPPIFQDLWKSWLREEDESNACQKQELVDAKKQRIRQLIDLIPTSLRLGDNTDGNPEESHSTNSIESLGRWEESVDKVDTVSIPSRHGLGLELMREFLKRKESSEYRRMEDGRRRLPITAFRPEILKCVADHPVTVLCAETGSGKTTQAPQFILEEALECGVGDRTSIICTQPRRISAMSVAERVADEMCVKLGDLVGYQIRGEAAKSSRTKLLFCTTGITLRWLQEDPLLSGVTTVVVDEVHERSWQIDFLLIALRRLLETTRPDLKVLLMSATIDSELFCSFFGGAPLVTVPGRTFPVAEYFLEDLIDATDHVIEEDSVFALRNSKQPLSSAPVWIATQGGDRRRQLVELESQTEYLQVSGDFSGYKMITQRSMDRVDEKVLNYDLIEDTLTLLSDVSNNSLLNPSGTKPASGSVLVFLPGMAEIRTLMNRLSGSPLFGNKEKFSILPLHSSLGPRDQRLVFHPPRSGCRKIILATNIAETSITIPDVVAVVDTGLVRELRQDKRFLTSRLVLDWCSKASVKQRAGRAGRVAEGVCCRLFSSRTAESVMKKQAMPELQRIPLEEVCLSVLAGRLADNCLQFLMQAPQPPPSDSVSVAVRSLCEIGIFQVANGRETLTALGQHASRIPVNVRLAKMLIFGALFKCLDPVLTIVGALSVKSPFAQSLNYGSEADAAQKRFRHGSSDFFSLVNLWDAYRIEVNGSTGQGKAFCRKNWISWTIMREIRDLRQQNLDLLCQIGFVQGGLSEQHVMNTLYNVNGKHEQVVHAVICSGLYPNIAKVTKENKDLSIRLMHKQERLDFHSSSVNHKKKSLSSDWIVFHEKFDSGRTTVSVTSPIHPLTIILFGGEVVVKHVERKVIVDSWIELDIAAQEGVAFRDLRRKLDSALMSMIEKGDNQEGHPTVEAVVERIRQLHLLIV